MKTPPFYPSLLAVLLTWLIGTCGMAQAAQNWYVTGSGDDARDGKTLATAFRTLGKAETLVAPDDTVLVGNGKYTDTDAEAVVTLSVSGTPGAPITWKVLPGQHPVIRPSGWQGITVTGSYQILDGLTIIGNNDAITLIDAIKNSQETKPNSCFNTNDITIEGRHSAPDAHLHHTVFVHNTVWNNKGLVPWGKIGKLSDGNGIFLDVTDQAPQGASNPNNDAAVAATAPAPPKPQHPEWKGRALIAYNLSAYNGGSGIHMFRTRHVDIVTNTTYWNGQVVGYQEIFANNSTDVNILNNICVPRPGGQVTSNNRKTNVRWDYNLYPAAQTVLVGPHDIVADPKFIDIEFDPTKGNFRLSKGSPGVGSETTDVPQTALLPGGTAPKPGTLNRGAY